MRLKSLRLLSCCVLLAGCVTAPVPSELPPDPLVERIFDSDGEELDREQLVQRMLAARVVYLGEKHDSGRHHAIQRELLEELVARGARPALGLEIFAREQTGLLMSYVTWTPSPHGDGDVADADQWLRGKLGWAGDDRRAETWRLYGALLQSARSHDLVSFGIDLPQSLRSRISRLGIAGLSHVERALLEPTGFADAGYQALMLDKLKAAHCGFGSEDYLGRLYDNWIARNDAMARSIVAALDDASNGPVVVIVGAGHLEDGMGVVERVAALAPGIEQLNFGMRELALEPRPLAEYLQPEQHEGREFPPAHEVTWFTAPAADAIDRCAEFLKAMGTSAS